MKNIEPDSVIALFLNILLLETHTHWEKPRAFTGLKVALSQGKQFFCGYIINSHIWHMNNLKGPASFP